MSPRQNGKLWLLRILLLSFLALALAGRASVGDEKRPAGERSAFITTPDGVKIHYLEAGKPKIVGTGQVSTPAPPDAVLTKGNVSLERQRKVASILFIPGWTMPAWVWQKQIEYFSSDYRVVAMDPRSQGESSKPGEGDYPAARARDIKAVVDKLELAPVVLVGWSLAVTEIASYVDQFGTSSLAGVVLVDGIAGGLPPESLQRYLVFLTQMMADRRGKNVDFIRSMFKKPQPEEYIQRLAKASLETPTDTAIALSVSSFCTDNRPGLAKIDRPALIVTTKGSFGQLYQDMQKSIAGSRLETFDDSGHALFVDEPDKFNGLLEDFLVDLR